MKNNIKGQSSQSSASINLYKFLNKHFFLLSGITCLSVVTIATIGGNHFCSTNGYFAGSTSSNSLDINTLTVKNPSKSLIWFYTLIILSCSATPWLLAYICRHKAWLITQKKLRRYPSAVKTQTPIQKSIPVPVLSTPKSTNPSPSAPSYRISAFKASPKKRSALSNNSKNIRLPFERRK